MAAHITPLTRTQLLDMETLFRKTVELPASSSSDARTPLDSNEVSLTDAEGLSRPQSGEQPHPLSTGLPAMETISAHPLLRGTFTDVFTDPLTCTSWSLHDKMAYLVWWSHRPASCTECGMTDCWTVSSDDEMKCGHCGTAAGSTSMNDIVEDHAGPDDDGDRDDDDDGGAFGGQGDGEYLGGGGNSAWNGGLGLSTSLGAAKNATSPIGGEAPNLTSTTSKEGGTATSLSASLSNNAVAMYMFFYQWLEHIPRTYSTGSSSLDDERGVVLPRERDLPAVLRAAYDVSLLLTLPSMTPSAVGAIRSAALYLSIVLHRFPVPFPLFRLGGRFLHPKTTFPSPPSPDGAERNTNDSKQHDGPANRGKKGSSSSSSSNFVYYGFPEEDGVFTDEELQWVDVEFLASIIGVVLSDFFEKPTVAAQYLQNVMTVARRFSVPSVLWRLERYRGRAAYIQKLRGYQNASSQATVPNQSTRFSTHGMSPDLTAMVVAIELARQFDSQAQNPEDQRRIGQWLDQLGLYPNRRCYGEPRRKGNKESSNSGGGGGGGGEKESEESNKGESGNAAVSKEDRWWAPPLALSHSPFAVSDDTYGMQLILPTPCANALLHIFALTFAFRPLDLAEIVEQSGIYRGPTLLRDRLRDAMAAGEYYRMSLVRRLSPAQSPWMSIYGVLHSQDRLTFLTALRHLTTATTRDKEAPAARLIQRLLRKHDAALRYQFHMAIRVVDKEEKHMNGVYFVSYYTPRLVIFTCARSSRKTITLDRETGLVSLCFLGAKERSLPKLETSFVGPIVVHVESIAAKGVMDTARTGLNTEEWCQVVRHLDRCGRARRRMRVPMLASRLDALASIREHANAAANPIAGATTLGGWGNTETLLAASGFVEENEMKQELYGNWLSLPRSALLYGLSENRVAGLYASLMVLLEKKSKADREELREGAAQVLIQGATSGGGSDVSSAASRCRQQLQRILGTIPQTLNNVQDPWPDYLLDMAPLVMKYPLAVRQALSALRIIHRQCNEQLSVQTEIEKKSGVKRERQSKKMMHQSSANDDLHAFHSKDESSESESDADGDTNDRFRRRVSPSQKQQSGRHPHSQRSAQPNSMNNNSVGGNITKDEAAVLKNVLDHSELYQRLFSLLSPPPFHFVVLGVDSEAEVANCGINGVGGVGGGDGMSGTENSSSGMGGTRPHQHRSHRGSSMNASTRSFPLFPSDARSEDFSADAPFQPSSSSSARSRRVITGNYRYCSRKNGAVALMHVAANRVSSPPPQFPDAWLAFAAIDGSSLYYPFFYFDHPDAVTPSDAPMMLPSNRARITNNNSNNNNSGSGSGKKASDDRPSYGDSCFLFSSNHAGLLNSLCSSVSNHHSGTGSASTTMTTMTTYASHSKVRSGTPRGVRSQSTTATNILNTTSSEFDTAAIIMSTTSHTQESPSLPSSSSSPHQHQHQQSQALSPAAATAAANPVTPFAANCFAGFFDVRDAETCRQRLMRLHKFVEDYHTERRSVEAILSSVESFLSDGK